MCYLIKKTKTYTTLKINILQTYKRYLIKPSVVGEQCIRESQCRHSMPQAN